MSAKQRRAETDTVNLHRQSRSQSDFAEGGRAIIRCFERMLRDAAQDRPTVRASNRSDSDACGRPQGSRIHLELTKSAEGRPNPYGRTQDAEPAIVR